MAVGLLMTLLSELVDHRLQARVRDADTQTSDSTDYRESIGKLHFHFFLEMKME